MLYPEISTKEDAWNIISVSITEFQLKSRIRGLFESHAELCDYIPTLISTLEAGNSEPPIQKILWSALIYTIQVCLMANASLILLDYCIILNSNYLYSPH